MGSGSARCYTGAFYGTGAALSVEKVGFRPSKVELYCVDDGNMCFKTQDMPDTEYMKQKAGATTHETGDGITITDTGFDIGAADADINTLDELVYFVCFD